MAIVSERLTALARILDGERVAGWVWESPLLGENIKRIMCFHQETWNQLAMVGDDKPISPNSTANKFDIRDRYSIKELRLYGFGLRRAAGTLAQGVRQQREVAEFDIVSAQRTFTQVAYILRLTCELPAT
jgi:hypothetical protein